MSRPVFIHTDPTALVVGESVTLRGDEGRHAVSVKRTTVGEELELVDGHGTRAVVTVTAVAGKDHVTGQVTEVTLEPAPKPTVTVVQALPKVARSELAVDLLTQAGADVIVPWQATRSVAKWVGAKQEKGVAKWQATAVAAAKQSRRARVPQVSPVVGTTGVIELITQAALTLVLHEDAQVGIATQPLAAAESIVLIIGPEGGISPEELAAVVAAGAQPVKLGPEVLRTASAGMVALAAIGVQSGRW
ncbi:MAG: 16S rRNA (uracil(1498)-N(3))-methyltransferase [Corynebacterium sp.]|nr:16S rRNA (uracil(1498)-N(3))-methyltransferase [Corynebacterium sp.]